MTSIEGVYVGLLTAADLPNSYFCINQNVSSYQTKTVELIKLNIQVLKSYFLYYNIF